MLILTIASEVSFTTLKYLIILLSGKSRLQAIIEKKNVLFLRCVEFTCFYYCSSGAVQPAWQVQETQNCIHKSAAAGAGASVQTE